MRTLVKKHSKKTIVIAGITAAVLLAGGGAAFAYWTQAGAGDGSAATGTTTVEDNLIVDQVAITKGMVPGGASQALSGTIKNPSDADLAVPGLKVTITDVVDSDGETVSGCTIGNYSLGADLVTPEATKYLNLNNEIVPAGKSIKWDGAAITFFATASNQDDCRGTTVKLAYAVGAAE